MPSAAPASVVAMRLADFPAPPVYSGERSHFERDPSHFRLDRHGVLRTYENASRAWEYNPTNVARYVLALYADWRRGEDTALPRLLQNADWLVTHAGHTHGPGGVRFAYYPLPVGSPAFHIPVGARSALTASEALAALHVASLVSGDNGMEQLAQELLPGFNLPIQAGGYRIPQGHQAAWFEEYASPAAPPPRVLNGHMLAVINLDWYARLTGNTAAGEFAQLGLNALRRDLHLYNDSPISAYDLELRSQILGYHRAEVRLLFYYYDLTGLSFFRRFAVTWARQG